MEYRREIDGLRAIAVVSVILYHAGFSLFSGGFVGVDVFFVISGYLITSIILSEKQNHSFTLVHFYERRARRILPALFVVMFVCIVFSWVYLLPNEMKPFGQSVTASAAFVSNIYFYKKNNDYFGLNSDQNPLLHLWSLSVEEQYYLIFPVLLIVLWRFGKRVLVGSLIILYVVSLAAAQLGVIKNPSATFFLLSSRGWELLMGSFIAISFKELHHLNQNHNVNQVVSSIGILLIGLSVFYFDKRTPFPSLWALMPTVGTVLVIIFATKKTLASALLANKYAVGIGLISFSAYLWHQPLFAFNRILSLKEPGYLSFLGLSILTLGLAYLSWRYIEVPFRQKNRFNRTTIFSLAFLGSSAFIIFGIIGHYNSGYPNRDALYGRLVSNFGLSLACNGNYTINSTCATSKTPEYAFLGNSYAMHLVNGFKYTYPNKNFVQLTQDSCAPYGDDQLTNSGELQCSDFYKNAISTITNNPTINTVFISSPFGDLLKKGNVASFENMIRTLKSAKKQVIIIGPTPGNGINFGRCFSHFRSINELNKCNFDRASIDKNYFGVIRTLKGLALKDNIKFIDLTDLICGDKVCKASDHGVIIYRDNDPHLTIEGSRYIFKRLDEKAILSLPN